MNSPRTGINLKDWVSEKKALPTHGSKRVFKNQLESELEEINIQTMWEMYGDDFLKELEKRQKDPFLLPSAF